MSERRGFLVRLMRGIELAGNKLPHPFWLFLGLWALALVLSAVFEGASATKPGTTEKVVVESLLNRKGLAWILTNMVKNFSSFPPLGLVLVMMIGLGVTNKSGFLETLMKTIAKVPERFLLLAIFLIGICGNIASDAAIVIVPPLTAALFFSMRKNPVFGLVIGYVAVNSGFTANLFIAGTDILLSGITTSAYKIVKPDGVVHPTANYFFMFASTVVISVVAALFVDKFMMRSFGAWHERFEGSEAAKEASAAEKFAIKENEGRAFKTTMLFTLAYWALMLGMVLVPGGPLRDPAKNTIIPSPFINGLVPILLLYFVLAGTIYGRIAGTIKSSADVIKGMVAGVGEMSSYIVLILPIANFIETFTKSNMATVMAIKMANWLQAQGFTGFELFLAVILISTLVNLFITSGSTKWAFMAPVLVPMMYYLGYSPDFTQLLYRIGDSCTNSITPMMPYFPILLGFANKYDREAGIGTIISQALPIALLFLVVWIALLLAWYLLGLPIGPGSYIRL